MSSNYKVSPSDTPMTSDVNQYAETLSGEADVGRVSLAPAVASPASAGTALPASGNELGVGAYTYAMTYVTGIRKSNGAIVENGETPAGPTWSTTTTSGNQRVSHTALPTPSSVTVVAKRLYRTTVGGTQLRRVVDLPVATTSYVDSTPDAALGANVPTTNTTGTSLVLGRNPVEYLEAASKAYVDTMSSIYWLHTPLLATFARASVAYRVSDGAEVAAGQPRYDVLGGVPVIPVEESVTPINTANQASVETDLTGWEAAGSANIEWSSAWAKHGLRSVRAINATSSTNRVRATSQAVVSGQPYTAQAVVYNPNAVAISVSINIGGVAQQTYTIQPGQERLIWTTWTATSTASFDVRFFEATGQPFHIDCFMFHNKAYPVSWHIGGATRSAETQTIPGSVLSPQQGAIGIRFRTPHTLPAGVNKALFDTRVSGVTGNNNSLVLYLSTTNRVNLIVGTGSGSYALGTNPVLLSDTDYSVVVEWGATGVALYIQGALEASSATPPGLTFASTWRLGLTFLGAEYLNGLFYPMQVFNAPLGAAGAAAWHAAGPNGMAWTEGTTALFRWNQSLSTGPQIGTHPIWHGGNAPDAGNALSKAGGDITGPLEMAFAAFMKLSMSDGANRRTRFLQDGSGHYMTYNANWDGTSWVRDDTGTSSFMLFFNRTNNRIEFRVAAAGTGNITWTTPFVINTDGTIGASGSFQAVNVTHGSNVLNNLNTTAASGSSQVMQQFQRGGANQHHVRLIGTSNDLEFLTAGNVSSLVIRRSDGAVRVNGVWQRMNNGTPEWSADGTNWNSFGPTAAQVRAIARRV